MYTTGFRGAGLLLVLAWGGSPVGLEPEPGRCGVGVKVLPWGFRDLRWFRSLRVFGFGVGFRAVPVYYTRVSDYVYMCISISTPAYTYMCVCLCRAKQYMHYRCTCLLFAAGCTYLGWCISGSIRLLTRVYQHVAYYEYVSDNFDGGMRDSIYRSNLHCLVPCSLAA